LSTCTLAHLNTCLLAYLSTSHFLVQSKHQRVEVYVKITYRDQEWELRGRRRVRDAVKEVGLIPHVVLAVRDGKLLTEDVMLEDKDEVKLIAVISGG